jgi:two-component system, OmpR family, sensor histidine kinase KdpD
VLLIAKRWGTLGNHIAAAAVCGATTLLALPLSGAVDLANIALLFVLAVVVVATFLGRGPSVAASFLAVACFDFFFVPPNFSFVVAHGQYLITLVVMLVVSLLISHLNNAYREKAAEAERRAEESALLHELATALAGAMTFEQVAERSNALIGARHAARTTLFLAGDAEQLAQVPGDGLAVASENQLSAARRVYATGKAGHPDRSILEDGALVLLPLDGGTRRYGVLEIRVHEATPDLAGSLLAAVAAGVSTAVERIHFVEVAQASSLAMRTERLRSSILSAVSHDLRTPLTVLYGLADTLLESTGLTPEQRDTAKTLRDHSHRLHRMVDNLLDMARLKSGGIDLRREWQSIPDLVGASVQAMAPWIGTQRVRFAWGPDLPLVEADAFLMERVLWNLLENAAKYSPPASTVTVGAAVDEADANRLLIWIDSEGDGFPPERLGQVFDLFARGSEESAVPGVGIGLAVCRAIVEAHGGTIAATNREGGARVTVALPLRAAPSVPVEPDAAKIGEARNG